MKITREQLRRCGAGYTDDRIATLVPADGLSPLEFAALDIPAEDRLWVLLRKDIIPARELRLLACGWAEGACRAAGWDDQRSLEAIAVARRFAVGEASEAELVEAWAAAWEARSEAWSSSSSAWSPRGAAAEAAVAASSANRDAWSSSWWSVAGAAWLTADAEEADAAAAWTADWASASARAEQLADVVRALQQIDEAAKAGEGEE